MCRLSAVLRSCCLPSLGLTISDSPSTEQSKTLFVRGLSEDTTEETLKESFEGSISARIVTDRDTGSSKGYVEHQRG